MDFDKELIKINVGLNTIAKDKIVRANRPFLQNVIDAYIDIFTSEYKIDIIFKANSVITESVVYFIENTSLENLERVNDKKDIYDMRDGKSIYPIFVSKNISKKKNNSKKKSTKAEATK